MRGAETKARGLVSEARAKAEEILNSRRDQLSSHQRARREEELRLMEEEGRRILEEARQEAARKTLALQSEIPRLVERLLKQLLPPGGGPEK